MQREIDQIPDEVDGVVIGGGPAGATVATLVALEGHSVAIFEREQFPRFHIGESLMPETYGTFQKLGFLERLRESASPVKGSVQFVSASGKESRPFYFFERNDHESSYTWQVDRAWFDSALLDNAVEKGAHAFTGTGVREVIFEGKGAVGVRVDDDGPESDGGHTIRSRVVVDASGQSSLIARRLGIRRKEPRLVKASVFTHYENGLRDEGIDGGATIIIHTAENRGWFWYIPLSENRVSVGVVSDPKTLFAGDATPEEVLEREISECAWMTNRLRKARKLMPARVLSDFSYRASRCAGDGWVLVGDAFGFLDPIYSSGVFLALKSGELAAERINEALRHDDCSAARLDGFGTVLMSGMEAIRKLVFAFYTPGFSFANFIREHPEHRERLTDILIGDVFKDGVMDIFDDMKAFCDLPDSVPLETSATGSAPGGQPLLRS